MTTTVSIKAHCYSKTTEVLVEIVDGQKTEEIILQDGESAEYVVYDNRRIIVTEVAKKNK